MRKLEAYTLSIGGLAFVDTLLTGTLFPVPVWVTFVAWASFFIVGGGTAGLRQSIVSNLIGMVIASLTLLAVSFTSTAPVVVAVMVGLGSAAMVQVSKFKLLNILPAIVWGFASLVSTAVATGKPLTTTGLTNPALVAGAALILGGLFGFVSEILGEMLTRKETAYS
jgi:hypothetical protein